MLKTMTFYLLFMLDQVTFNHLAYIVMVLFGIIYNFWNVSNLTFIQLNYSSVIWPVQSTEHSQ